MTDISETVDTLRTKLRDGERGGSDADREALLAFSDHLRLLRENYSDYRHEKLLRHCTRISEHAAVALAETVTDTDAAKEAVRWIHDTYDNEETNRDYRTALRTFGKRVIEAGHIDADTDDAEIPLAMTWISTRTSKDYNPAPDWQDMLTWDDAIRPMLDACHNARDEALIALQFDAGLRGGELFDLRRSDIADGDYGLTVAVDGKTGERTITLIPAIPHVSRWLDNHPGDADDYLWSGLNDAQRVSYRQFLNIFKDAADRAEVSKPVTPTNFRKSSAFWLATQGASNALIEDRQGRERGSDAIARYVARANDSEGARYAALQGLAVDAADEPDEELAPVVCPRCDRETPHDKDLCVWCGNALTATAATEAESTRETVIELLDEHVDDPETADSLVDVLAAFQSDPRLHLGTAE